MQIKMKRSRDGAGKAGNIVAAAATGLVAARDILEREEKNEK